MKDNRGKGMDQLDFRLIWPLPRHSSLYREGLISQEQLESVLILRIITISSQKSWKQIKKIFPDIPE